MRVHLLICFMLYFLTICLVTCLVVFDERLNSFTNAELHDDSRSSCLIAATQMINSCVLRTDNGPQLWRYFPTPLYRKLERATKVLEEYVLHLIILKTFLCNLIIQVYVFLE